jgi:hypothetical protein
MTVRVYRSTDASAPALTGQVGSLIALLDAVLVNGYGAVSAAGWTKSFSTTNKAAYRQNATGAVNTAAPMYLYVDDTGPGAGAAREARACGFETMSAITPTGTGQFPTAALSTIGIGTVVIRKSVSADTTPRPWTIIANGQTIYLFTETGDNVTPVAANCGFMFGDIKSYKSGDLYSVMIMGRQTENNGSSQCEAMSCIGPTGSLIYNMSNVIYGHYIARHWTQLGSATKCGKIWDLSRVAMSNSNGGGLNGGWQSDVSLLQTNHQCSFGRFTTTLLLPYPHGPDQGLLVSPVMINHNYGVRGYLPGFWGPLHDRPLGPYDTITIASGNLAGKTFMAIYVQMLSAGGGINGDFCCIFIEVSDTWS